MTMTHRPSNNAEHFGAPQASISSVEEWKLEREWGDFLLRLHREMVGLVWEKKEASLPLREISPTIVFIYEAERMLFPEPKVSPKNLKYWEKAVEGHEKLMDGLLKENQEISQYIFLIKQRLAKLKPHIVKFLT